MLRLSNSLVMRDEGIDRVLAFLGYGPPSAPVWFIGLEEGLGRATDNEAICNLQARGGFKVTMDLAAAHRLLKEDGKLIDIETKRSFTQVWLWMAKIMLARVSVPGWRDTEAAKTYIRQRLGRTDGETFLTELSPVPTRKQTDKFWMEWFRQQRSDLDRLLMERSRSLRLLILKHRPSLTICYGATGPSRSKFIELFPEREWHRVGENVEASQDRRLVMLPFFGQGHMSHAVIETLIRERLLLPKV